MLMGGMWLGITVTHAAHLGTDWRFRDIECATIAAHTSMLVPAQNSQSTATGLLTPPRPQRRHNRVQVRRRHLSCGVGGE
jgi:hypothetical protein